MSAVVDLVVGAVEFVGDVVHKAADLVVDTVKAVIDDPLPTLLAIGGSMIGIPIPITNAVVTAARGGSLEDVAKSYAVSQIAQSVPPEIAKAINPQVSAVVTNEFAQKALTNAISEGLVSGTISAINGGDFGEGFAGGFAGSAISSGTQKIIAPSVIEKTKALGFSEKTGRAVSAALSSAIGAGTESSITGGDFSAAFTRSLANAGTDYAAMSAAEGVEEYVNKKIASNDDELQAAYKKTVDTNQAVIENSASQKRVIDEANARAMATDEKGAALQKEIDDFQNDPNRTIEQRDALQAKIDAFNIEHQESTDFVKQKEQELQSLTDQQQTLFKDYETSVNEAERLAANFDETEAANAAKVKEVFDVNQEYKTLTGEDLTEEKLLELEKSGNLRDAVAKDLGYESTEAMQNALTMKSLPTDVAPKLEPREGEIAGALKKEILEDGSVVYERQFSGTAPDGTPYVYKATYDALNPDGVRYDMVEGVAIADSLNGSPSAFDGNKLLPSVPAISGTERPNFGNDKPVQTAPNISKTPQDYLDDIKKSYSNYVDASLKASTQATPENIEAANKAKLEAELAQKIATDNGVVPPPENNLQVTPLNVPEQPVTPNQTMPVSEKTGVNETVAPPTLAGDLLGGLAGAVVKNALTPDGTTGGAPKTVGTTVPKTTTTAPNTTVASGLSNSVIGNPSIFFEAPNIMLTPQQIAERENFILSRKIKRGGLVSTRKK
jgi:hypothetical protein